MKGIRKYRKWLHEHSRFRRGLLLALLVLGVDVCAAACAGNETFSLSEEGGVQGTEEIVSQEASAQNGTAVLAEESDALAKDVNSAEETTLTGGDSDKQTEAEIYVYVTGAVINPGVYSLPDGARIYEAAEAAGGLREDAAAEYVNQASLLRDGEQIYFPTREETEEGAYKLPESTSNGGTASAESLPQNMPLQDDANAQTRLSGQSAKININTADKAALLNIPGVGEKKAEAIIEYRNAHGAFGSIEEIMKVAGIKEASFQKMKDSITVE